MSAIVNCLITIRDWFNAIEECFDYILSPEFFKDFYFLFYILIACGCLAFAIVTYRATDSRTKPNGSKRFTIITKYFRRFVFQITVAAILVIILYPLYRANGFPECNASSGRVMSLVYALYHALRFFVFEGDIAATFTAIEFCRDTYCTFGLVRLAYYVLIGISLFLAPVFTVAAIMSAFRNIRSRFQYFTRSGDVHVFSELNEKSFALADSILQNTQEGSRAPVIVFTDVLEPDNELQYDLQESAERRGAICFRSDLESINYRRKLFGNNAKLYFYLLNEGETEKIRQASHVCEHYNENSVFLYIFSDNIQTKMFLESMPNKINCKVKRIDESQSLIYHTLEKNGIRLFETAKRLHLVKNAPAEPEPEPSPSESKPIPEAETDGSDISLQKTGVSIGHGESPPVPACEELQGNMIIIRAVLVGFGGYGHEMFKALLWYCQMPGYELEIHVCDSKPLLKSRIEQEFPDLMRKNMVGKTARGEKGDAHYWIHASDESIDVSTVALDNMLEDIKKPTFFFVALGGDEVNIQTSRRIREFYLRKNQEPDIQTVVYDTKVAEKLNYDWPKTYYFDAAYTFLCRHVEKVRASLLKRRSKGEVDIILDMGALFVRDRAESANTMLVKYSEEQRERTSGQPCFEATMTMKSDKMIVTVTLPDIPPEDDYSVGELISAFEKARRLAKEPKPVMGAVNHRKEPYMINMIGDLDRHYTRKIIINSELHDCGCKVDERWFNQYIGQLNDKIEVYNYIKTKIDPKDLEPCIGSNGRQIYFLVPSKLDHPSPSFEYVTYRITVQEKGSKLYPLSINKGNKNSNFTSAQETAVKDDSNSNLDLVLCLYTRFCEEIDFLRKKYFYVFHEPNPSEGELKAREAIRLYDDTARRLLDSKNFVAYFNEYILHFIAEYIKLRVDIPDLADFIKRGVIVLSLDTVTGIYTDCSYLDCKDPSVGKYSPVARLDDLIRTSEVYAQEKYEDGSKKKYDCFEYNQRSSITKYLHETLRYRMLQCGYLDDELKNAISDDNFFLFESLKKEGVFEAKLDEAIRSKPESIKDTELKLALACIEHIRWNVYMRTEGYSFGVKRNDLARQHPNLLPVQFLSIQDIRKDV